MRKPKHKALLPLSAVKPNKHHPSSQFTFTDSILPETSTAIQTNKSDHQRQSKSLTNNDIITFNNNELFNIYKRISLKETREAKSNIEKAQKQSKAIQSFKRTFKIPPSDSNVTLINQSLIMNKDKIMKQVMDKDKLLSDYLTRSIKHKNNPKCINDYYIIERNLVNMNHDKQLMEKEYEKVLSKSNNMLEENDYGISHSNSSLGLNHDHDHNNKHIQMRDVELNENMLKDIKEVIQKQKSTRVQNEDKSISLLTGIGMGIGIGIGIGGISDIMTQDSSTVIKDVNRSSDCYSNSNFHSNSVMHSMNSYNCNSNNNKKNCYNSNKIIRLNDRLKTSKRKINIMKFIQSQRDIKKTESGIDDKDKDKDKGNAISAIANNDNVYGNSIANDYTNANVRDNDTHSDTVKDKKKDAINSQNENLQSRLQVNDDNVAKALISQKYSQFKREMRIEEKRHFNNRIFSKDQIDAILKSKRHLKMNQMRELIINKNPKDNSLVFKSFNKSISTPKLSLPQINPKDNLNHNSLLIDKLILAYDESARPVYKYQLKDFIDFQGLDV